MGAAAASAADVVIITDDNPRNEEPAAIRAQVRAGAEAARRAGDLDIEVIDGGDRRGRYGKLWHWPSRATRSRSWVRATK